LIFLNTRPFKRIRILDIRPPYRPDLTTGSAKDVQFFKVDISDAEAVDAAFQAQWPSTSSDPGNAEPEITIFHTAANIRFYERHLSLVPRSAKVNVNGTQNIIRAALLVGATVLVQTSSGSVAVRSSRFWLWPWEKEPKHFVQVLNDDDSRLPKRHEDFFSNYAATKLVGEGLVRKANGTPLAKGILRTGSIRPGNGIFGPGR
jgi:nucleoside-diphosphate-sugar epimerase